MELGRVSGVGGGKAYCKLSFPHLQLSGLPASETQLTALSHTGMQFAPLSYAAVVAANGNHQKSRLQGQLSQSHALAEFSPSILSGNMQQSIGVASVSTYDPSERLSLMLHVMSPLDLSPRTSGTSMTAVSLEMSTIEENCSKINGNSELDSPRDGSGDDDRHRRGNERDNTGRTETSGNNTDRATGQYVSQFGQCHSRSNLNSSRKEERDDDDDQHHYHRRFDDDDDEDDTHKVIQTDPSGRFECFNLCIGKGAYKEVFKAFDQEEGMEVAWNQLRIDHLTKRDIQKTLSEVHILQQLRHENIINFYHVWSARGLDGRERVYFITELMSSGTLKSFIRKTKGKLKPKVLKNWCRQILRGLNYLHSWSPSIIHRDLKCDNIFINGNNGIAKIGDLGLATIKHKDYISSVLGTPEFMAPELYDEKYDEKVDIYAFGMCVLEMFTKEYPYQECTNQAQIYKKVTAGIMPLALNKLDNIETRQFIEMCIDHNTQRRPIAAQLLEHSFLAVAAPIAATNMVSSGPQLVFDGVNMNLNLNLNSSTFSMSQLELDAASPHAGATAVPLLSASASPIFINGAAPTIMSESRTISAISTGAMNAASISVAPISPQLQRGARAQVSFLRSSSSKRSNSSDGGLFTHASTSPSDDGHIYDSSERKRSSSAAVSANITFAVKSIAYGSPDLSLKVSDRTHPLENAFSPLPVVSDPHAHFALNIDVMQLDLVLFELTLKMNIVTTIKSCTTNEHASSEEHIIDVGTAANATTRTQEVKFPFNLKQDTPEDIVTEMMREGVVCDLTLRERMEVEHMMRCVVFGETVEAMVLDQLATQSDDKHLQADVEQWLETMRHQREALEREIAQEQYGTNDGRVHPFATFADDDRISKDRPLTPSSVLTAPHTQDNTMMVTEPTRNRLLTSTEPLSIRQQDVHGATQLFSVEAIRSPVLSAQKRSEIAHRRSTSVDDRKPLDNSPIDAISPLSTATTLPTEPLAFFSVPAVIFTSGGRDRAVTVASTPVDSSTTTRTIMNRSPSTSILFESHSTSIPILFSSAISTTVSGKIAGHNVGTRPCHGEGAYVSAFRRGANNSSTSLPIISTSNLTVPPAQTLSLPASASSSTTQSPLLQPSFRQPSPSVQNGVAFSLDTRQTSAEVNDISASDITTHSLSRSSTQLQQAPSSSPATNVQMGTLKPITSGVHLQHSVPQDQLMKALTALQTQALTGFDQDGMTKRIAYTSPGISSSTGNVTPGAVGRRSSISRSSTIATLTGSGNVPTSVSVLGAKISPQSTSTLTAAGATHNNTSSALPCSMLITSPSSSIAMSQPFSAAGPASLNDLVLSTVTAPMLPLTLPTQANVRISTTGSAYSGILASLQLSKASSTTVVDTSSTAPVLTPMIKTASPTVRDSTDDL